MSAAFGPESETDGHDFVEGLSICRLSDDYLLYKELQSRTGCRWLSHGKASVDLSRAERLIDANRLRRRYRGVTP